MAIAALVSGAACQWVAHLERPTTNEPLDAGSDVEAESAAPECAIDLPLRPSPRIGGLDVAPFTMALSTVAYTPTKDEPTLCDVAGFPLDDKTTCIDVDGGLIDAALAQSAGKSVWSSSCDNPHARALHRDICDGPGGIDNGFAKLYEAALAATQVPDAGTQFGPTAYIRSGRWNLLIRVAGYNGEADDDEVSVGLYQSAGLEGTSLDAGSGEVVWDGGVEPISRWTREGEAAECDGYVASHVLVVPKLPPFSIRSLDGSIAHYKDGLMMGRLAPVAGSYEIISGRIGGAIDVNEILRGVANLPAAALVPEGGTEPMCIAARTNPTLAGSIYEGALATVCQYADLPVAGLADAASGCSEMSAGANFRAVPIELGGLRDELPSPDRCAEAGATPNDCSGAPLDPPAPSRDAGTDGR